MRLAHRIYTLHLQSKDQVIFTYQRVFKFLLETLTVQEFELISFYSVNRLIDNIFATKVVQKDALRKQSLKQFVYKSLQLNTETPTEGSAEED